jgi:hypothetical protein
MNKNKLNLFKQQLISKAKQSIDSVYHVAAIGFNSKGEKIKASFNKPRYFRKNGGVHPEMYLLTKYPWLKSIIIVRINSNGKMLPIEPCSECKKRADKLGVTITTIK